MKSTATAISLLIGWILVLCVQSLEAQEIYVSPSGDDTNSGTMERPLKTFPRAVQAVKEAGGSGTVYFREGTYVFDETVVINNDNCSGQVTFRAYQDEKVTFTSLVKVEGWSDYSEKIKVADLPGDLTHVRYLQDTSENWMPRSATQPFQPAREVDFCNEAPMYAESYQGMSNIQQYKTFLTCPSHVTQPNWSNADQFDLRYASAAWSVNVLPVSSFNPSANRVHVATPSTYVMLNPTGDCSGNQGWILNSIGGIDEPGEWASINGKV